MSDFVGIEQTSRDDHLIRLLESPHWPNTSTDGGVHLVPEKGAQHGAVTLLRTDSEQGKLRISWAVFLPIPDNEPVEIDLGGQLADIRILLHGYFFLDAGRRRIEWLDGLSKDTVPDNEADLRRTWNTRLRDSGVLPLILPLLKYALDRGVVTEDQFPLLVQPLAADKWFGKHREVICKHSSLVRVLEGERGSRQVRWRLVPTGAKLRPLPATLAGHPERVDDLFDGIDEWKSRHRITLCIDKNASLTFRPMCWTTDELDLLEGLTTRVFQSDRLARVTVSLLSDVVPRPDGNETVGREVLRAFRCATIEATPFAPTEIVSRLLQYVPRDRLIRLPVSVRRRDVLRALAQSDAAILPTRHEFVSDDDHQRLTPTDLELLLRQLEPIVQGDDKNAADQAAASALTLLENSDNQELRRADGLQDLSVIRAHRPDGTPLWLSFGQLFEYSDRRMLFQQAPRVERYLSAFVMATPAERPLVIDTTTNNALGGIAIASNRASFCNIINSADQFGDDYARLELIDLFQNELPGEDDDRFRRAMRVLCAGGQLRNDEALWDVSQFANLERVVKLILADEFLVPDSILHVLTPAMKCQLGIKELNDDRFQELIIGNIQIASTWELSNIESKAFLKTNLDNDVLYRLPIHPLADGTNGSGSDLFWVDETIGGWRIPEDLQGIVRTVQLYDDVHLRDRQKEILRKRKWSRRTQIEVALSQDNCHVYQQDINAALPLQQAEDRLIDMLRRGRWLMYDGRPIAPENISNVPSVVDDLAIPLIEDYKSVRGLSLSDDVIEWLHQHNVIPDRRSSLMRLADMIRNIGLVGRLGSAESYPVEHFRRLVTSDLKLPGWPLLASLLPSLVDYGNEVVMAFQEVPQGDVETTARHLNALSELAERGVHGAEEAYRHGFEAVARWNSGERSAVFHEVRVPTESGAWRKGAKVVAAGRGIVPTSVLRRQFADIIGEQERVVHDDGGVNVDVEHDDLKKMRKAALEQHRIFLKPWCGVVPSELITIYLLVGIRGNELLHELLPEGWQGGPVSDQLDDLRCAIEREQRVRGLVFLTESTDDSVEAISLTGEKIIVPLLRDVSGIVVGNCHRRTKIYQESGRNHVRIIDTRVRSVASEDCDHIRLFCEFIKEIASECLS